MLIIKEKVEILLTKLKMTQTGGGVAPSKLVFEKVLLEQEICRLAPLSLGQCADWPRSYCHTYQPQCS